MISWAFLYFRSLFYLAMKILIIFFSHDFQVLTLICFRKSFWLKLLLYYIQSQRIIACFFLEQRIFIAISNIQNKKLKKNGNRKIKENIKRRFSSKKKKIIENCMLKNFLLQGTFVLLKFLVSYTSSHCYLKFSIHSHFNKIEWKAHIKFVKLPILSCTGSDSTL